MIAFAHDGDPFSLSIFVSCFFRRIFPPLSPVWSNLDHFFVVVSSNKRKLRTSSPALAVPRLAKVYDFYSDSEFLWRHIHSAGKPVSEKGWLWKAKHTKDRFSFGFFFSVVNYGIYLLTISPLKSRRKPTILSIISRWRFFFFFNICGCVEMKILAELTISLKRICVKIMWGFLMCWFQVAETEIYNPHQPKYHLATSTPIKGLLLRKSQIWRHKWISNCIKAPRALNSNISGLLFFHFAMFSLFYLTQKKRQNLCTFR